MNVFVALSSNACACAWVRVRVWLHKSGSAVLFRNSVGCARVRPLLLCFFFFFFFFAVLFAVAFVVVGRRVGSRVPLQAFLWVRFARAQSEKALSKRLLLVVVLLRLPQQCALHRSIYKFFGSTTYCLIPYYCAGAGVELGVSAIAALRGFFDCAVTTSMSHHTLQRNSYWGSSAGRKIFNKLHATDTKSKARARSEAQHQDHLLKATSSRTERLSFAPLVAAGGTMLQVPTYDKVASPGPYYVEGDSNLQHLKSPVAAFTKSARVFEYGTDAAFAKKLREAEAENLATSDGSASSSTAPATPMLPPAQLSTSPRARAKSRSVVDGRQRPRILSHTPAPRFPTAKRFDPNDPSSFLLSSAASEEDWDSGRFEPRPNEFWDPHNRTTKFRRQRRMQGTTLDTGECGAMPHTTHNIRTHARTQGRNNIHHEDMALTCAIHHPA